MTSAIVAIAKNGVIGKEGALPWYLPAELANFKKITMGHPIIMGRKTHESIGRPLPGRTNIIITHDPNYVAEDCFVTTSLNDALMIAESNPGNEETFVIGGASIYELAMPQIDRIYLTKVDAEVQGDKFFRYNPDEWKKISSQKHPADAKNQYAYEFAVLDRK